MKKFISATLAVILIAGSVLALSSCAALSGAYEFTDPIASSVTTLEFSGDKARIYVKLGNTTTEYEAKYEIIGEEGDRSIVFTYAAGAPKHPTLYGERSFSEGEKEGKDYIKIGLAEYYKK